MEERNSEGRDQGNRTRPAPDSMTRALASTVTRNGYIPSRRRFGKAGKPAAGTSVSVARRTGFGLKDSLRDFGPADAAASATAKLGELRLDQRSPSEAHRPPGAGFGPSQVDGCRTRRTDKTSGLINTPVRSVVTRVSSIESFGSELRVVRLRSGGKPAGSKGHTGCPERGLRHSQGAARLARGRTSVLNRARRAATGRARPLGVGARPEAKNPREGGGFGQNSLGVFFVRVQPQPVASSIRVTVSDSSRPLSSPRISVPAMRNDHTSSSVLPSTVKSDP